MNSAVKLWRNRKLKHSKKIRSCTLLIALVIAPVVCALMFSESMMDGIAGKYICLSDGHLQVRGAKEEITEQLSSYAYSIDRVTCGYALLYSSSATSSCLLKGIEEDYFNEKRLNELTFEIGSISETNKLKTISLSKSTAEELGVTIGDKIAVMIVPDSNTTVLRPVMMMVESLFYTGYDKLDRYLAFIDGDYARQLFPATDSTLYEILLKKDYSDKAQLVSQMISLDNVSTWEVKNASIYNNFQASREAIFIVLITIIFVAGFYTASVAQQLIQDDLKDIAINKLIGMSDRDVRKWAFSTVFSVTIRGSAIGTLSGTLLGFLLSPIMKLVSSSGIPALSNYLLDFKVSFPTIQILQIIAILWTVSAVSVMLCLSRTRRITPIQLFTD